MDAPVYSPIGDLPAGSSSAPPRRRGLPPHPAPCAGRAQTAAHFAPTDTSAGCGYPYDVGCRSGSGPRHDGTMLAACGRSSESGPRTRSVCSTRVRLARRRTSSRCVNAGGAATSTRISRPAAQGAGLTRSRPYDLRHSFASLLIHEGVSVIEVARQVGNSPDVTLTTYAHVFEEFEPAARVTAADAIRSGAGRVRSSRRVRGAGRRGRRRERRSRINAGSRRPDSNRGPLHYE